MLQVIPAVDVLDGSVVRLTHGDFDRITVYDSDPVRRARQWMAEGAQLIHVVDLDGARTGAPAVELWEQMARARVRFQVGGGIRTVRDAELALATGAERIVLGTAAVWEPGVLASISDPQAVVAAVDVRAGQATGGGWLDGGRPVGEVLEDLAGSGIERLLVTGIGRDGTMEGPEVGLLETVTQDGRFRIIASGGVGSLDDLATVSALGCEAVIVGRALYEGRFTLGQATGFLQARARLKDT
ncbi:MAG: 1-(5-phosphoribosyl)-5-[(5-phosphoribosylamino)methylideneamino] imidazole-4-carboxamide isomerase [Acidimicrobiia bacterium]|nr:1-(5-phosphoribosyl)-5-[(5-phosphoribosylamino)methylideneamino] imidazole-4-carboxamide isomerase [Acidimicrobiia bacterium]